MTLGVWVVAWFAVMALFWFVGDELERQPLPVRAVVMTGVMVILMMHVVEPAMRRVVRRLASRPASPSGPLRTRWLDPTSQGS